MTAWRCSRQGSRISISEGRIATTPEQDTLLLREAAQRGRALVWQQTQALSPQSTPWALEYVKAMLGQPETLLGSADALAEQCAQLADSQTQDFPLAPNAFDPRSLWHALQARGLSGGPHQRQTWADRLHFLAASAMAIAMLLLYLVRFARGAQPAIATSGSAPLIAVHGEWSNRTRHLLGQIGPDLAPSAILVLGRPQTPLSDLQKRWSARLQPALLPALVVPASASAALRALPQLLASLRKGLAHSAATPYRPALRAHAALVFRVLLGGVMAQWWRDHGPAHATVLFGHTGTGDTAQLEKAMQGKSCKTTHVVHGLCTGPNFAGFSNHAHFHCALDAQRYSALQQYGHCSAHRATMPQVQRGDKGLLLLTNYAHPMNPGYQAQGLADELQLLRSVAELAGEMGEPAQPLQWKPHPAIGQLPATQQATLRREAQALGYVEITDPTQTLPAARGALWVLTTPSTMAVDLLSAGCLPIVLDVQASASDDAVGQMPSCLRTIGQLRASLPKWQTQAAYAAMFETVWERIGPAREPSASELTSPPTHH